MKSTIYLFLLIGLFSACSKDETPIIEANYYTEWQSHPEVTLDKIYLQNGLATEDKLYVVGNNYFLTFNENHELEDEYLISTTGVNIGYTNIPTITKKVFGYKESEYEPTLYLHSNENPDIKTAIDFNTLDTMNIVQINTYYNEHFVITDDNILIVPCRRKISETEYKQVFYRIQLDITPTEITYQVLSIFQYPIFHPLSRISLTGLSLRNNDLYFNTDSLFKVNLNSLETNKIRDLRFGYFMEVQDTFFIIGHDYHYNLSFNYSVDDGQNFNLNLTNFDDNGYMRFAAIDNQIIGYRGGSLIHFQVTSDFIAYASVNTTNIYKTFDIEKILTFKDRVYLVGRNGLHSKSLDSFLESL